MKTLIILCISLGLATAATRNILDEEEFLHAKQFRDEALEVEREVAKLELLARQAADVAEVVPAPLQEGRHVGLGLGLQLGPVGAGASAGLGWHGLGVNGLAGYGGNYLQYGQPQHYSQYWSPAPAPAPAPVTGPWVTVPASRTIGLGGGLNIGPVGVGASAGLGHGNFGFSGGLGWGGDYSNYGSPAHYQQYHSQPYLGPYFHPQQLV